MTQIKSFATFLNEDHTAMPYYLLALKTLEDTIFQYEPKENTKYSKKGYVRFVDTYGSSILYVSKNSVVLMYSKLNHHNLDQEQKAKYDGSAAGLLTALQTVYNYYRFFNEHYPEPGRTYSLTTGRGIDKPTT